MHFNAILNETQKCLDIDLDDTPPDDPNGESHGDSKIKIMNAPMTEFGNGPKYVFKKKPNQGGSLKASVVKGEQILDRDYNLWSEEIDEVIEKNKEKWTGHKPFAKKSSTDHNFIRKKSLSKVEGALEHFKSNFFFFEQKRYRET